MLNFRNSLWQIKIVFLLLFSSCAEDVEPACEELPASFQKTDTQKLFLELAFDQEFGQGSERLRKWSSPIRLFIDGAAAEGILAEVDMVISEINDLSTEIPMDKVTTKEESNLILYLGKIEDYIKLIEPGAAGIAEGNSGFAAISWNKSNEIVRASACVDVINFSGSDFLKHVIREELAQSLGLINDTNEDRNSIFYQFDNQTTGYSETDKTLISYMLGDNLMAGMCKRETLEIVK